MNKEAGISFRTVMIIATIIAIVFFAAMLSGTIIPSISNSWNYIISKISP